MDQSELLNLWAGIGTVCFTAAIGGVLSYTNLEKQRILGVLEPIEAFYKKRDKYFENYRAFIEVYTAASWKKKKEVKFDHFFDRRHI